MAGSGPVGGSRDPGWHACLDRSSARWATDFSLWRRAFDNPSQLLSSFVTAVGTIIAAVIIALLAFRQFRISHDLALKSQQHILQAQVETQFYEALRRFGNPDSPAARSSAAGLSVLPESRTRTSSLTAAEPYFPQLRELIDYHDKR